MDTSYMAIWCNSSWPIQLLEQWLHYAAVILRCFPIDSRIRINKFRQGKLLTVRCWPSCPNYWTPSPYPTSLSSSKTRKFGAHSAIVSGSPVIVRKRKSSLVPSGRNCFKLIPIFSLWPRTELLRMKRQMAATWQSTPDLQDFQSADGSYSTYPIFSRFVGHCEREWSDECTCLYSVTSTEIKFQTNEFIELTFSLIYLELATRQNWKWHNVLCCF